MHPVPDRSRTGPADSNPRIARGHWTHRSPVGRPITGEPGIRYENVPPEDDRHCPDCRDDRARQPPGLFKALFGRRD